MSESLSVFKDYHDYIRTRPGRYGKSTLFENENILVGLNYLDPGQTMDKHAHQVQVRFYLILEGSGYFRIGDQEGSYGPGTVIWVPTGNTHQVQNLGKEPLVMLVGIAPTQAN